MDDKNLNNVYAVKGGKLEKDRGLGCTSKDAYRKKKNEGLQFFLTPNKGIHDLLNHC